MPEFSSAKHDSKQPSTQKRSAKKNSPSISPNDIQRAIETPNDSTLTPGVVLQLQRTHGNQFVLDLMNRANQTPTASVQRELDAAEGAIQREIQLDNDGVPVLSTYFDDAYKTIQSLVRTDIFLRFKKSLPDNDPMADASFDQVWNNVAARQQLKAFMDGEYNSENYQFLVAVEQYKPNPTADKAVQIYNQFINQNSNTLINLPYKEFEAYRNTIGLLQVDPSNIPTRGRSGAV